jgi:hypothetical protein
MNAGDTLSKEAPMWIFCAGMPRSGSTLQFQLTAHLVEHAARGARVEWVAPEEFPRLRERYAGHAGWKVFKSHHCTPEMAAELEAGSARAVYVFRDVRDVVVSRMRKRGQPFDRIWNTDLLEQALTAFDRWTSLSAVLVSRYEELVADVPAEVARIAAHLGIAMGPEQCKSVASEYTVARQRERIRDAEATGRLRQVADGAVAYDPVSNLHLDHIQSGRAGEWKSTLSEIEVAMIEDRAGDWLVANGYGLSLGRWRRAALKRRYLHRRVRGAGGRG